MKLKRGIKLPLRIIIAAIMILLQITLTLAIIYSLSEKAVWIYYLIEFGAILLTIYIINDNMNPSFKISWVTFILLIPLVGVTSYVLWGGRRVMPHLKKRMEKSEKQYSALLPDDSLAFRRLEYEDLLHAKQAQFLKNESKYPVYSNTEVEYLSPGEIFLPRLIEELEKAEEFIFIEFFILAEGKMWDEIHTVLKRKAAEGVEVRIIFDDFGSINRQSRGFVSRLKLEGILVSAFNRIRPSVDLFMNNRNHRKIVVIDGKVAVTGGLNIGDEYINLENRFGHWMDCAAIFRGDAVRSFTIMFLNMWTFITGKVLNGEKYIKNDIERHDGFILPYCDSPLNRSDPAQGIYMQILNTAQRYVYIASPYLIIGNEMRHALCLAAKSGIDVRIITPSRWDKWYVHPVTQRNYEALLEAGVKIYEYTPGFIHSKLFISDDSVATVGTVNMDYRSFFIHFECGAWLCRCDAVKDMKEHYLSLISQSKEITLKDWRHRPFSQRLKQYLLNIFSPFM